MTWKEFKEIVEEKGVKDDTELDLIKIDFFGGIRIRVEFYGGNMVEIYSD